MKVVAKEIECIAYFSKEGIKPIKFKYENTEGINIVIKVDKVISRIDEKLCGNLTYIFECQSLIKNEVKQYQLKYFILECKWLLWKI